MSTDVYADGYAYSHLHQPAGPHRDPIVVTGARRFKTMQAAMDAAAQGQPPERSTCWDPTLTDKTVELSRWEFGTVTGPGHEVVVAAHPIDADSTVIVAAWHIALTQKRLPSTPTTMLTMREQVAALQHEPAPRYATDAQIALLNAARARNGHAPYPREKLDRAAERLWLKAQALSG